MKTYTVQLTEREIADLRAALPQGRPVEQHYDYGQRQRQWDLDDKLKRVKPDSVGA